MQRGRDERRARERGGERGAISNREIRSPEAEGGGREGGAGADTGDCRGAPYEFCFCLLRIASYSTRLCGVRWAALSL